MDQERNGDAASTKPGLASRQEGEARFRRRRRGHARRRRQAVTEEDGAADTTIKVAWADWQDMSDGKLDGMTAFMQGKLKVEGDMSNAMQLQGVLAKLRG